MKQLLELPLNLTIVSPAHTPNWDLVSDVVNSCSRIYRSSKQCRNRYENVLIPREEGKVRPPCFSGQQLREGGARGTGLGLHVAGSSPGAEAFLGGRSCCCTIGKFCVLLVAQPLPQVE